MRLVDLIPLQEIDFASQKGFDAYNKAHKLRPDTKVTIAGKKTTAGQASKVKGTSVFAKDKEQKKSFKDLGIDRDSAVNAHLDAKKAAKGEEPAKINSNFSMDVVKMLRKANISDVDDNTTKLLSKLQKVKGETVADTKTGKVSYFLYDGSRYEMNIDVKNKSIRTKELKPTGGGNKPKDLVSSVENHLNKVSGGEGYAQIDDGSGAIVYNMGDGDMPTYTLYMGNEGGKHRVSLEPTYGNDPKKIQGKIDKSFDNEEDAIKYMGAVAKKHRRELEMQDK